MLIRDVRYEILDQDEIIGQVVYNENNEDNYILLFESYGFAEFYLDKKDLIDQLKEGSLDYLDNHSITEFHGIIFNSGDYEDIYAELNKHNNDYSKLIKLLIAVTRLDAVQTKELINNSLDKDIKEISIPLTDYEE